MFLIVAGPTLAETIASRMQLGPVFKWAWWVLQWPVVFAFVVSAVGLVYYFAPDVEQDWVWITPGAILATLLWLGISLALKLYYQLMPNANAYGTIGGVMVLMLWFYVSGLALLLGAELNAEIEHASPYGKDPGERVAGEKRVVGPRAQRFYEEKQAKRAMPLKPIPDGVNCDIDRAPVRWQRPTLSTEDLVRISADVDRLSDLGRAALTALLSGNVDRLSATIVDGAKLATAEKHMIRRAGSLIAFSAADTEHCSRLGGRAVEVPLVGLSLSGCRRQLSAIDCPAGGAMTALWGIVGSRFNPQPDDTVFGKLAGVAEQVLHGLTHFDFIGLHQPKGGMTRDLQGIVVFSARGRATATA